MWQYAPLEYYVEKVVALLKDIYLFMCGLGYKSRLKTSFRSWNGEKLEPTVSPRCRNCGGYLFGQYWFVEVILLISCRSRFSSSLLFLDRCNMEQKAFALRQISGVQASVLHWWHVWGSHSTWTKVSTAYRWMVFCSSNTAWISRRRYCSIVVAK